MVAKFRNGGQACTAANRFYVHEDVAEEFSAKFGERIAALRVGDAAQGAEIGPVISEKAADGIRTLVEAAAADGAQVRAQAELPPSVSPTFVAPQLLTGVAADAAILGRRSSVLSLLWSRGATRMRSSLRPTAPPSDWRPTSTRAT